MTGLGEAEAVLELWGHLGGEEREMLSATVTMYSAGSCTPALYRGGKPCGETAGIRGMPVPPTPCWNPEDSSNLGLGVVHQGLGCLTCDSRGKTQALSEINL